MQITLVAVGNKMPAWVEAGFLDYAGRLKNDVTLQLKEIALQKRSDNKQVTVARKKEEEQILQVIAGCDYVVALDIPGKEYSSEQLAQRLTFWQNQARHIALIIGGPEGLGEEVKAQANEFWSLGKLTMPHPLVRIVVAEAIYRAWSINQNHPYHRA